jgi:hypothetical protein
MVMTPGDIGGLNELVPPDLRPETAERYVAVVAGHPRTIGRLPYPLRSMFCGFNMDCIWLTDAQELAMVCTFGLDNFIINNPRSLGKDTDYCTVSVTVGNNAPVTKTQAVGDVGDGTHALNLAVQVNIPDNVPTPVVFSYLIVNNGHGNHADVQKGIEASLALIGKEGAQAIAKQIAQPIGDAVGTAIGASIGTAVVPLVGTALGAIAGFVVGEIGGLLFANCDGTVAAGVRAFVSGDLLSKTASGHTIREGVDHPGTDSPSGCGANSKYATNTTISSFATITPNFDINGKYTAGGAPGPIVHLSGNSISVDMSAYHRPTATGTLITNATAQITFSDDKTVPNGTYTVAIIAPGTLKFQQNNSTWVKSANLFGTLLMSIPAAPIAAAAAGPAGA